MKQEVTASHLDAADQCFSRRSTVAGTIGLPRSGPYQADLPRTSLPHPRSCGGSFSRLVSQKQYAPQRSRHQLHLSSPARESLKTWNGGGETHDFILLAAGSGCFQRILAIARPRFRAHGS